MVKLGAEGTVDGTMSLFVRQVMEGGTASKSAIRFQDLGSQCHANVNGKSKVPAEGQFVIGEGRGVVTEHYLVIPTKLANVADVGRVTGHDSLWHFAIGHIDVIAGRGAHKCLQLNAVVPKGLGGSGLDHLT